MSDEYRLSWRKMHEAAVEFQANLQDQLSTLRAERDALLEIEKMRDEEIASLREAHGTALVERDALQARIAESEKQEPVACIRPDEYGNPDLMWIDTLKLDYQEHISVKPAIKLYTHPFIQPAGMMLVPVEWIKDCVDMLEDLADFDETYPPKTHPTNRAGFLLKAAPTKGE